MPGDILLIRNLSIIELNLVTSSRNGRNTLCRAVFTHRPKGPGPRAANFQGRHIKKIEIEVWYAVKKKAVHEKEI
jgi:hypothetical protein